MKKAWIVLLLSILMTACSASQNEALNSESDSETVEAATVIVTEATTTTETTLTQAASEPVETAAVKEVIRINKENISDYVYDGETQTVGDETNGYLEIPIEFEYYEPYERIGTIIHYVDDESNRISMKNCDSYGFRRKYKDIDELAEFYDYSGSFKDAGVTKYDVDGYTAYKITYSSLEAINPVNYKDEYTAHWIFECEDGVIRGVNFCGKEEFVKTSDNILKTFNLYN